VQPSPRWSYGAMRKGMDSFIVFGGAGETFYDEILVYNSYHATWKQAYGRGPGPAPRWGHACVFQEEMGVLFVFGGCTKDATTLRDIYQFSWDEVIYGAPPVKRYMTSGEDVQERNTIVDRITEEKPSGWEETKRNTERRWSARGKRHTQGNIAVLTEVAPFAEHRRRLYATVGFPTIGGASRKDVAANKTSLPKLGKTARL